MAIDRPSQGGNVGGGCKSALTVAAGFSLLLTEYALWANGLMLQTVRNFFYNLKNKKFLKVNTKGVQKKSETGSDVKKAPIAVERAQ